MEGIPGEPCDFPWYPPSNVLNHIVQQISEPLTYIHALPLSLVAPCLIFVHALLEKQGDRLIVKRTSVNFIVDVIAFSCFVYLAATGVLIRYVLPPGSGHFSTIWGLDRHEWGSVHFWTAIVLLCTIAVHLILHWSFR